LMPRVLLTCLPKKSVDDERVRLVPLLEMVECLTAKPVVLLINVY